MRKLADNDKKKLRGIYLSDEEYYLLTEAAAPEGFSTWAARVLAERARAETSQATRVLRATAHLASINAELAQRRATLPLELALSFKRAETEEGK